jgi:hypothetical protein
VPRGRARTARTRCSTGRPGTWSQRWRRCAAPHIRTRRTAHTRGHRHTDEMKRAAAGTHTMHPLRHNRRKASAATLPAHLHLPLRWAPKDWCCQWTEAAAVESHISVANNEAHQVTMGCTHATRAGGDCCKCPRTTCPPPPPHAHSALRALAFKPPLSDAGTFPVGCGG